MERAPALAAPGPSVHDPQVSGRDPLDSRHHAREKGGERDREAKVGDFGTSRKRRARIAPSPAELSHSHHSKIRPTTILRPGTGAVGSEALRAASVGEDQAATGSCASAVFLPDLRTIDCPIRHLSPAIDPNRRGGLCNPTAHWLVTAEFPQGDYLPSSPFRAGWKVLLCGIHPQNPWLTLDREKETSDDISAVWRALR